MRKIVKAKKVRSDYQDGTGDFIPGLDNGYVVEVIRDCEDEVTITFHDAEGNENTITCGKNMMITVERR